MSLRSQNGKPLSNICTGEVRKREREKERERDKDKDIAATVVYIVRYLQGVVGMAKSIVAVVLGRGKERDVCIGDVPTMTENIKGVLNIWYGL